MLDLYHTINIEAREPCLGDFMKYVFNGGFHLHAYKSISQNWVDEGHHKTQLFDITVNYHNLHSWSQGNDKAWTCAVIL